MRGNVGPIHKLIVRDVGVHTDPHSTAEFEDFEIEHLPDCEKYYNENFEFWQYTCAVGEYESDGVRWYLNRIGARIIEPGEYKIQAWAEVIRGYDFTEYDGGLALVDDDEANKTVPVTD